MAQNYSYTPLSTARSTRILLLEPHANREAALRCSLEEVLLDEEANRRRQYDALSYVWGAKTGTQPLLCDDKTILITSNCESALRCLRKAKRRVTLWVDAIAIDQQNLVERAEQVSLMAEIYHGASEVIVWLGQGTDRTAQLFSRMSFACRLLESSWFLKTFETFFDLRPRIAEKVLSTLSLFLLGYCSTVVAHALMSLVGGMPVEDICNLIQNDWVTRVWTYQEHAHASRATIMCGDARVTWNLFSSFVRIIIGPLQHLGADFTTLMSAVIRWSYRDLMNLLLKMIQKSRSSAQVISDRRNENIELLTMCVYMSLVGSCSEPHDRVYALYGLLALVFEQLPSVDYTQSPNALYEDFTRITISSTGKFWPASLQLWRPEAASSLPSWVPDLTSRFYHEAGTNSIIDTLPGSDRITAKSTRDSQVSLCPLLKPTIGLMALKGMVYSKILAKDQRWPSYSDFVYPDCTCLGSWISFCANNRPPVDAYEPFGGVFLALGRTIAAGSSLRKREALQGQFRQVLAWSDGCSADESILRDYSRRFDLSSLESWTDRFVQEKRLLNFISSISGGLVGHVLFLTSNGHIGMTAGPLEQGDIVALLSGSDRPVILRHEGDKYCYIGSAHIQGIMDGEAWPSDTDTDTLETLVLV